jgi:FAS-associated factor 2
VERQAEEPRPRRAEPRRRARAPPVARVGILNTLTWPIRFVLRIVSGLWYLLGKHSRSPNAVSSLLAVRNVLPLGLLPYMPRFLLPPSGTSTNYPSIPLAPRRSFPETLRQECPDGYMPDFWRQDDEERPTYKEFLNHLKTERKVGCVVLCCADHEDDLDFKR